MPGIFFKRIIRCEVQPASKPEDVFIVVRGRLGNKATHIHVYRRHERIAWMYYQRNAHGLPRPAGQVWARRAGRGRQRGALYMTEQHCSALENGPAFEIAA